MTVVAGIGETDLLLHLLTNVAPFKEVRGWQCNLNLNLVRVGFISSNSTSCGAKYGWQLFRCSCTSQWVVKDVRGRRGMYTLQASGVDLCSFVGTPGHLSYSRHAGDFRRRGPRSTGGNSLVPPCSHRAPTQIVQPDDSTGRPWFPSMRAGIHPPGDAAAAAAGALAPPPGAPSRPPQFCLRSAQLPAIPPGFQRMAAPVAPHRKAAAPSVRACRRYVAVDSIPCRRRRRRWPIFCEKRRKGAGGQNRASRAAR